jgi:hypothetical protein
VLSAISCHYQVPDGWQLNTGVLGHVLHTTRSKLTQPALDILSVCWHDSTSVLYGCCAPLTPPSHLTCCQLRQACEDGALPVLAQGHVALTRQQPRVAPTWEGAGGAKKREQQGSSRVSNDV